MGRHTVRFKCHNCNHCCTEVVALPTPADVVRIAKETGRNPYRFLEFLQPGEIEEVPMSDPTWLDVDGEPYMMALQRDEKNGCHFLDRKTRFCTIYESRPLLCRLYPFKLNETRDGAFRGFSLHTDVGCPRNQDGVYETEPLYELYLQDCIHQNEYNALVRRFNRKQYEGKSPSDFIAEFITVVPKKARVKVG